MAWICPKCNTWNFGKNGCECCGYNGKQIDYDIRSTPNTGDPLPEQPITIC